MRLLIVLLCLTSFLWSCASNPYGMTIKEPEYLYEDIYDKIFTKSRDNEIKYIEIKNIRTSKNKKIETEKSVLRLDTLPGIE